MNHRASLAFLCLFAWSGCLVAEEERPWSHWTQVGGDIVGDRGAFVRSRSRRDPAKDDERKGFAFEYELHNEGNTLTARVSLWHAVRDPASGRWLELDRSGPANTSHDVPPLETVSGTAYAPSVNGLYFESDIKWLESAFEMTGEKNIRLPKKPGQTESPQTPVAGPDPKTASIQTEFEGAPLSDREAVEKVVRKHMDDDEDLTYRATLVFQIPPGRTEWVGVEDDVEVDMSGTWRERMEYWLAFEERPLVLDGRDVSYQARIISVTGSEMVVEFDRVPKGQMVRYLTTEGGWAANHHTVVRKMEIVRKR